MTNAPPPRTGAAANPYNSRTTPVQEPWDRIAAVRRIPYEPCAVRLSPLVNAPETRAR
ncbi:hypothetical protein NFX46_13330 [Streptomyces phaeoluteigriseus]|uniref:Uncharacterized protein n=1 Tax=Streptomyces phaeoluteigriseus TaxID=114686 RepID=A0ABY4Z6L6_9ACTN|nr:hypothetical protein [Streptomyces phaeoluteigriseus]USQ84683.1 hypothetical protein NFX46_13330 [Streptomyces phaeoluteigriseus]